MVLLVSLTSIRRMVGSLWWSSLTTEAFPSLSLASFLCVSLGRDLTCSRGCRDFCALTGWRRMREGWSIRCLVGFVACFRGGGLLRTRRANLR